MSLETTSLPESTFQDYTVLIVDDNPGNLAVLSDHLQRYGFQIMVARSGESALKRVHYAQPDIILLDVMLPGIDGFETCRRLKAHEDTRDIPVIFMTVLTSAKDKVKGFELGAVDYVTKPLMHEEVLARITTHLRIKDLTQELLQARDELEKRVKERTAELAQVNEELKAEITERVQAETEREALIEELEAKNAELERFVYTASHDLKSPLITIKGFLGFLERDALAGDVERMRADMARISDATDNMHRLLGDLLQLSRIGRLMNPPEEASFDGLAREAVGLVKGRLDRRGVEVVIAPDLPAVHGDRARLVEVLQNLVDNAVKFMGDQPEPRIEVGVRRDGEERVFYVRDNGIGIDPRYHEKVFGLFEKLDPQAEGTGVGLTIVKRIVEVHGGRVWVESEGAGQGSAFCFTLADKNQ